MKTSRDECPLIPMWAITGAPSREFLRERMKNFRSVGITQLMIYARSGLELEYMSDAWLDRCEWICEDAASLGFTSIWLYDEKNWPSGTCNGEVMRLNPDHAIRALCVAETSPGEYEFSLRRGTAMADLFNPEAVDSFIRLTHERYEKRLGKYFGNLIKGFFTDEPDIAFFAGIDDPNLIKVLPYYEGLEEEYLRLTSGELRQDILRGLKTGSSCWQIPFNKLVAKRFRESFADRLSRWCGERGMVQTGHLMNEFTTSLALRCNGHILEVLSGFSFPGIDDISTPLGNDRMEYLTFSSGMYAIEKQQSGGGLAELFALGPCDMTLERMCSHFFFCAAFGISRFVLAVAQTVARGNVEKDRYFNPLSETQPWFEAFRELGDCAKLAAEWAGKERDCEIAVRYPYEPQPLSELLADLADAQLNWKLLLPGEETDAPVVLACAEGGIREERSGVFFDLFSGLKPILDKLPRRAGVIETDGTPALGIFLRTFHDGSALVINLSGRDRDLLLNSKGKNIAFHLYPTGYFTWEPGSEPENLPGQIFDLPADGWDITLDSLNTMRAEFENGVCKFSLTEDLPGLRLVLRNCGAPADVLLDGKKIDTDSPCRSLPQGFREIYRESAVFSLPRGRHSLTLCGKSVDYPYLPAAFLTGRFAVDSQKTLSAYHNDGQGLYGYAGKIRLTRELVLPPGTDALRADTLDMAAELSLDGTSLGRRIRNPFCWANPGKNGPVRVELTVFTSCGRLFGGEKTFLGLYEYRPDNSKAILAYRKN